MSADKGGYIKKIDWTNKKEVEKISIKLLTNLLEGKSSYETLGFTDDAIKYIYETGRYSYQQGEYAKAMNIFNFLLMLDGNNPLYKFSIASCLQSSGDFASAIEEYADAGMMDPHNPKIDFEIARCFIRLNNSDMAKKALEHASKNDSKGELKENIKILIDSI